MLRDALRFEMLGRFRVFRDDGQAELAPGLPALLLAILLLNPDRQFARDELAEMLWPDEDPQVTRTRLRQVLIAARKMVGDKENGSSVFDIARTTLRLPADRVTTDVREFRAALASARGPDNGATALHKLAAADQLYRGDLLPGFYHDFILTERERLCRERSKALHDLADAQERAGHVDEAIETAKRVVALEPLSEESHLAVMRLYSAAGQAREVARQYGEMERLLRAELGVGPSDRTRELFEELRESKPAGRHLPRPGPVHSRPITVTTSPPATAKPRVPLRWGFALVAIMAVALLIPAAGPRKQAPAPDSPPAGTVSYPAAVEEWRTTYQKAPNEADATPSAIAVEEHGSAWVTGFVQTANHDVDFLTFAVTRNGAIGWSARYNGPSNDVDRARDIALGPDESVIVVGDSDNGKGNGKTRLAGLDITTIKYDKKGRPSESWPDVGFGVGVRRYTGPSDGEDWARKVKVDIQGNVYVLGTSWSRKGHDIVLIKYGVTGKREWVRPYGDPDRDDDAADMGLDVQGNVFVAGTIRQRMFTGADAADYVVLKYAPDGHLQWAKVWGSENDADDTAWAITVSRDGAATIVGEGYVSNNDTHADIVILDYLSDGSFGRMIRYAGPGPGLDRARLVAASPRNGPWIVAGTSAGNGIDEAITLAYPGGTVDNRGRVIWKHVLGAYPQKPGSSFGVTPKALQITGSGCPTICMDSSGVLNPVGDALTVRYTPSGQIQWIGAITYGREPRLGLADAGQAVVACQLGKDIVVVKYSSTPSPSKTHTLFATPQFP